MNKFTLEELEEASKENIKQIDGIGEELAEKIQLFVDGSQK
jgi:ERCC4-type nuclease